MLDLNDLRSFVTIIEHGGFAAAAREIGVQTSTLSRRMAALEASLGESLIHRNSGQFRLTDFGQALHDRCLSLTGEAMRLEEFAKRKNPAGAAQAADNAEKAKPLLQAKKTNCLTGSEAAPRRQDLVQLHILQNIRNKTFVSGDKLPSERNLAAQLGVARQAVREAIRSLEMSGVLRLERGSRGGAFIRDIGPDGISYSIRNMLILGHIPLNDLLELRASSFGHAGRLAALHRNAGDILQLEQNIERLERGNRGGTPAATIKLSTGFYRIAAQASRNKLLAALVDAIADIIEDVLMRMESWPFLAEGEKARHDALDAIRAGEGEKAEAIIRAHCEQTNAVLLEFGRSTLVI